MGEIAALQVAGSITTEDGNTQLAYFGKNLVSEIIYRILFCDL